MDLADVDIGDLTATATVKALVSLQCHQLLHLDYRAKTGHAGDDVARSMVFLTPEGVVAHMVFITPARGRTGLQHCLCSETYVALPSGGSIVLSRKRHYLFLQTSRVLPSGAGAPISISEISWQLTR